jgi:hypothetical protein
LAVTCTERGAGKGKELSLESNPVSQAEKKTAPTTSTSGISPRTYFLALKMYHPSWITPINATHLRSGFTTVAGAFLSFCLRGTCENDRTEGAGFTFDIFVGRTDADGFAGTTFKVKTLPMTAGELCVRQTAAWDSSILLWVIVFSLADSSAALGTA